jgi:hypothetical protein
MIRWADISGCFPNYLVTNSVLQLSVLVGHSNKMWLAIYELLQLNSFPYQGTKLMILAVLKNKTRGADKNRVAVNSPNTEL